MNATNHPSGDYRMATALYQFMSKGLAPETQPSGEISGNRKPHNFRKDYGG
jgi:hypothetical protein